MRPTKYAVLPAFILTETCEKRDPLALSRSIPVTEQFKDVRYYLREVSRHLDSSADAPRWMKFNYNLFPLVLDRDGIPWDVAAIYIISRCQGQVLPDMTTFHGIAEDLSLFLRFLEEFDINYTSFPKFKLQRPTYRFHGYLKTRIHQRKIAAASAKRAMGSVIGLYRFLVNEGVLTPENPMWQSKDEYLTFKDARGLSIKKEITVTDVSISAPKQDDPYDGCIDDGEKLRPLPQHEQEWIFEALSDIGNPEMLLIHLLMVTTGARIQTALTFRVRHVLLELPSNLLEFRFPVGPGTGVDTKNDKQMTLHIHRWMYEAMKQYASTNRAKERRMRAKGGDTEDQYLFLTQQGGPYYQQKIEALTFDPDFKQRYRERGQTFRMFIRDRVIPWVRDHKDRNFHYRPHDLRATFGMNLSDVQLAAVERKEISLSQARDIVKTRMGHESSATTDLYLSFRQNEKMIYAAIDGHEQYFRNLIEKSWAGTLDAKQ